MADMWVSIRGTRQLAERACRMVFGEDADAGPKCPAPKPLLAALKNWPKDRTEEAVQIGLELPMDFDVGKEMGKGERKAVTLMANRITVLHQGRKVGYAIRTNQIGLNAIRVWQETWEAHLRKIRQAH